MELRLEDLQTEESHTIDAAGATLGRDSRRSSITIPDPGVSGAHARIFSRGGRYYIEDTNSSNGTFAEGTRLRGELELKDGIVISLHKYKFRVSVAVNGTEAADRTGLYDQKNGANGAKTTPKVEAPRAMQQARTVMQEGSEEPDAADEPLREGSSIHRNPPTSEAAAAEVEAPRRRDSGTPRRRDSESLERRDSGSLERRDTNEGRDSGPRRREIALEDDSLDASSRELSDLGPAFSSTDVQGGFGQALAYYLGAVPRLAFAPVSATQQLIAEQPFPPLDKMDLVIWAAPPLIVAAFVNLLASIILAVVGHSFGVATIIRPIIIGAIIVVIGCVVAGWIWHPLVDWWIRLLKGESNPRGRTNMFVATYTGVALTQIAAGLGMLFALMAGVAVIGPFIQIVPLALTAAAGLITLYVAYAWHGHFRVMELVPKIIMVLAVVLIASTAWSAIGMVRASIASANAIAQAKRNEAAVAAAQAEAARLQAEAEARTKTAQDTDATDTDAVAVKEPSTAVRPTPAITTSDKPSERGVTTSDRPATPAPSPAITTSPPPPPTRTEPARSVAADDPLNRSGTRGRPTFTELNEHMDAIEKAVTADPSLLSRMDQALALYKKMHATQSKYKVKSKDPVAERIRQAELYGALVDTVEELYDKVAR